MRKGLSMGGFSVVELVAVIAVVAILAATAFPRFFDVGLFQGRAFYEEAIASVRYAQKLAVATRCPVRVEFTDAPAGYSLYRPANVGDCTGGAINVPVTDPAYPGSNYTRTAPGGVTVTAANFSFTAAGSASVNVTITVGDYSFRVHDETGFVQDLGGL